MKMAWLLARKDLALYLRDRTALLLSLALPIFLATIFGAAMGGMSGSNTSRAEFLVEDLDQSDVSKALISELTASAGLRVKSATDVRRKVADGDAPAALLIPHGFAEDFGSDHAVAVKLYRDPGQAVEQQVILANLLPALARTWGARMSQGIVRRTLAAIDFPVSGRVQAERMLGDTWDSVRALAAQHASADGGGAGLRLDLAESLPTLFGLEAEDVAGSSQTPLKSAMQSHAVSGTAVMMLLFGLVACGGTLLEERDGGTLVRLQLTPASGASILLGKMLFAAIAGVMQVVILFAYGSIIFDIPILRDPIALAVHSLAVVCAATGVGICLAVACRTRKQLEGLGTLVILVMSALGGSWFPLIATPAWFQSLGHLTLNAWAMDGYQAILWYGKGLGGMWIDVLVLLAIAVCTMGVATLLWKRRFEVST